MLIILILLLYIVYMHWITIRYPREMYKHKIKIKQNRVLHGYAEREDCISAASAHPDPRNMFPPLPPTQCSAAAQVGFTLW